jgi:type I restriction enzyme R subunit
MNKKDLSERDICTKFITPAVVGAGWDVHDQIREEVGFTKGRIIVRGKLVTRGKAKRADYILYYKPNIPLALIEAKDNTCAVGDGMQQALSYAETLDIPFVFSSNGNAFVFHDRTGTSAELEKELELLDRDYRSPIPTALQWRAWAADPEGITGDELLAFVNGRLFPQLKELPLSGAGGGDRRRVVRDVFEDAYNYMKSGQLMSQVVNKITGVDFNDLAERQHFGDVYEQCSTICRAPATPASTTRRARSPPSWPNASIRTPARSCSIPPAAPAASSPAPSATCASAT